MTTQPPVDPPVEPAHGPVDAPIPAVGPVKATPPATANVAASTVPTSTGSISGSPAVRTRGLTKDFGDIHAVAGVDLELPHGAVFGLLGPDGAGKSTLIRMLATVLAPDAGKAEVFGHPVDHPAPITRRIGYMSQRFSMYPDLTVAENLEFFARIRGVDKTRRRERAGRLLESMGMAQFTGRQARFLSGGMKQKLMLASTLMHDPDLLLLDEPTTGVDPLSRREFWTILAGIHAEGRTVLVATPYMDEAERCTHIAFMDAGRLTRTGTPDELKAAVPGTLLEVHATDPRAVITALDQTPGIASTHLLGDVVRVLASPAPIPTSSISGLSPVEAPPPGGPSSATATVAAISGLAPVETPAPPVEPVETASTPDLDELDQRTPDILGRRVRDALAAAGIDADVRPVPMDMESVYTYLATTEPREAA